MARRHRILGKWLNPAQWPWPRNRQCRTVRHPNPFFHRLSIVELDPELNCTRIARRGHETEGWSPEPATDPCELRVVEGIVELGADLNARVLRQLDVLEHVQVPVGDARATDSIAAGISEETRRLESERFRVEPLVDP